MYPHPPTFYICLSTIYIMLSVLTDFGFIQDQLSLSHLVGGGVVLLVIWRLWRFTIRPLLNPDSPREVPYLIPSECCT